MPSQITPSLLASFRWGLFISSTASRYPSNASAYCALVAQATFAGWYTQGIGPELSEWPLTGENYRSKFRSSKDGQLITASPMNVAISSKTYKPLTHKQVSLMVHRTCLAERSLNVAASSVQEVQCSLKGGASTVVTL